MTPSLSSFIGSLFAGALLLALIFLALGIVSTTDRIIRE